MGSDRGGKTGAVRGSRRWRERLLALACGVILVFVVLEVALRVTSACYWRDEGRPGADPGCILPAQALECAACPKILVMGDSYTYGVGAWKGHDYPTQLQNLLNTPAREHPVVVVNGGLGAANSTFVLERLQAYLERFTPDLVLVLAGGTNAINFSRYYSYVNPSGLSATIDALAYHVRTIRFIRYAIADLSFEPKPPAKDPYFEISPAVLVDLYAAWVASHAQRGHHLGAAAMQEGLDRLRRGDYRGAASLFEKRLESSPGNAGYAWGLAFAYRQLGDYSEAYRVHQQALRAVPGDPLHLCGAGMCRTYQGLADRDTPAWYQDANRLFRQGMAAAPDWSGNYCGLGTVLELQREREEAVAMLKRGIAVDPDDPRCYPSLIALAELLGKHVQVASFLDGFSARSAPARSAALLLRREEKAASAWVRHDLNKMVDVCQSRGIPVILQDYPHDTGVNAVLRSIAHDRNVPIVRHREVFEAMLEAGTPLSDLFVPDMHCNDRGYEIMARNIYQALEAMNLFPHPSGACGSAGGQRGGGEPPR